MIALYKPHTLHVLGCMVIETIVTAQAHLPSTIALKEYPSAVDYMSMTLNVRSHTHSSFETASTSNSTYMPTSEPAQGDIE